MTTSQKFRNGLLLMLFVFCTVEAVANQNRDTVNVSIQAVAGMQYDLVRFKVRPKTNVRITFSNADDMSHNLLITAPGARQRVVEAALKLEENGPAKDYIPQSGDVLIAFPVLAPGQVKSLLFTAPDEPGVYPYVCTFPGHGFIMYGAIYVTEDEEMPGITEDHNIPSSRRKNTRDATHVQEQNSLHPYQPRIPYLYRTYMEGASPAAIAVRLSDELAYCWDAGTCRLRYAWQGGFVDNQKLWKGKPNAVSDILGNIFYTDQSKYPIRIGESKEIPEVNFKGYRLINRFPEFHYTFNGTDIYEIIYPKDDGSGIVRIFRVPDADQQVTFHIDSVEGVEYTISSGKWENNSLILSSHEAKEFSITITMKNQL